MGGPQPFPLRSIVICTHLSGRALFLIRPTLRVKILPLRVRPGGTARRGDSYTPARRRGNNQQRGRFER
jgi:hypothetical protein